MPIYVSRNNQQLGPFEEAKVLEMLGNRELSTTDLAIREGEQKWQPLAGMYQGIAVSNPTTQRAQSPNEALNGTRTINGSDRFAPLNEEERSKLLRMRMYKFILSLFFGLITLGAVVFVVIDYKFAFIGLWFQDLLPLFVMWTIPLGITLLLLYKHRKLSKDIKEGNKQIIVARVEEVGRDRHPPMRKTIMIAGNHIDVGPRGAATYTHWVRFNGMKIIPRSWVPNKGDMAELYIGPHSKRILSDLIKRSDALPTESSDASSF